MFPCLVGSLSLELCFFFENFSNWSCHRLPAVRAVSGWYSRRCFEVWFTFPHLHVHGRSLAGILEGCELVYAGTVLIWGIVDTGFLRTLVYSGALGLVAGWP